MKKKNSNSLSSIYGIAAIGSIIIVGLQISLINSYTSTDFEVHRNWMAITYQLPLSKWYYEATSEWTLDYPPYFAYFEKVLSIIAAQLRFSEILSIQSTPYISSQTLNFQRITVIGTYLFFILCCVVFSFHSTDRWERMPKVLMVKVRISVFLLLITNAGLVMVDNIHFQYNAMLTAFLMLALYFADRGKFLLAAISYCVLINFKHIYLYYAPAFVFFYLRHYFEISQWTKGQVLSIFIKGLKLALVIMVPFGFSLGPFLYTGGSNCVLQIVSRLFPVQRGLTHAYWAPNFWAMYNFVDLFMFRVTNFIGLRFLAPTYNSGLVQVYSHSVLPSVGPTSSLICIIISLIPVGLLMAKKKPTDFTVYLTLSAFSFFFFGYHVHEKAILLLTIPCTVAAFTNPVYLRPFILLSTVATFSLFPLLYTFFEVPIKYAIGITYFLTILLCVKNVFHMEYSTVITRKTKIYIVGLIVAEVYNTFVHKFIFAERLQFLPLMIISIYNSIGVLWSYIWIVIISFEDEFLIERRKIELYKEEKKILEHEYHVPNVTSLNDVKIIGGVDISKSKTNEDLAVVSFCLFDFPGLHTLASFDKVLPISAPYISDHLALREADPIAELINESVEMHPALKPDVVFVDGNGKFHSRGCGLACHVSAKTDIPTIGVAKNFNLSVLHAASADKGLIEKAYQLIASVSNSVQGDGFAPFDLLKPVLMNIARVGGSRVPVFISSGFGIDLDLATQIVLQTSNNRVSVPIRAADLRSREKVREFFGE